MVHVGWGGWCGTLARPSGPLQLPVLEVSSGAAAAGSTEVRNKLGSKLFTHGPYVSTSQCVA